MKSKVQGWENNPDNWTDIVPYYFTDDKELKIGNYLQTGLFSLYRKKTVLLKQ